MNEKASKSEHAAEEKADGAKRLDVQPAASEQSGREQTFSRRELLQWSMPAILVFGAGTAFADTPTHTDGPHQDSHNDYHSDNQHGDSHVDNHFDHTDNIHSDHNDGYHGDAVYTHFEHWAS